MRNPNKVQVLSKGVFQYAYQDRKVDQDGSATNVRLCKKLNTAVTPDPNNDMFNESNMQNFEMTTVTERQGHQTMMTSGPFSMGGPQNNFGQNKTS